MLGPDINPGYQLILLWLFLLGSLLNVQPGYSQPLAQISAQLATSNGIYEKDQPVEIKIEFNGALVSGSKLICETYRDIKVLKETLVTDLSVNEESINLTLVAGIDNPGFYFTTFKLITAGSTIPFDTIVRFGYNISEITSKAQRPTDFKDFWDITKMELAAVKPKFKLKLQDSLSSDSRRVYLVEMRSLDNVLIRGWYTVPAKKGVYPAILKLQGYSSNNQPVLHLPDFAVLSLNIRGHGNSQDDINPGFPGFLTYGLADKMQYIYRGAYMDCIRAIDFLSSRKEVDKDRMAVLGESQGGGLAFATAALDDRIDLCVPRVPFLSDFRNYVEIVSSSAFISHVENTTATWEDVFNVLDYFDVTNLANWIDVPVFMSVGLQDLVCPNHINFAAFNTVGSEKKEYVVFPETGHGMWKVIGNLDTDWIRTQFSMPIPY